LDPSSSSRLLEISVVLVLTRVIHSSDIFVMALSSLTLVLIYKTGCHFTNKFTKISHIQRIRQIIDFLYTSAKKEAVGQDQIRGCPFGGVVTLLKNFPLTKTTTYQNMIM